ncbi:MAG: hypothetical protein GF315_05805 [candidate division Zixibacteria bacterium]|nr:hypothetical protein [candidate division Zixibacteria bacterium]
MAWLGESKGVFKLYDSDGYCGSCISILDAVVILKVDPQTGGDEEAPEGKILLRYHETRERNASLVRRKKESAQDLICEVCGFGFEKAYGDLGKGFIECHYIQPLSELRPGQKTRLSDLTLVCANCHRILHRGGDALSIGELRKLIKSM